ncbi:hypothetical protein ACH5RR_002598 [Cinchona calisaya]|uniref:KIB1-4 beta-propeller domain-containing protein n=1 Tax=Cinchona calisaya TaxID=153742 RepID=A0ABD3ASF1_9GENT
MMSLISKRLVSSQARQVGELWRKRNIITNRCPAAAGGLLHSKSNLRGFSSQLEMSKKKTDDQLEDGCRPEEDAFDKLEISKTEELKGFPCLFVPFGFDMNEDTGRIIYTNTYDWFLYLGTGDNVDLWSEDDPGRYHFLNIANKKLVNLEKNMRTMWRGRYLSPDDSKCIGSSKGWLAFMNKHHGSLYLFNPLIPVDSFSYPFIPLPPIETLPTVLSKVSQKRPPFSLRKPKFYGSGLTFISLERKEQFSCSVGATFTCTKQIAPVSSEELSKSFIKKVVLSSSPTPFPSMITSGGCSDDTVVMIIHGYNNESQLAFCRLGDETWTALNGPRTSYQDITYFSKDQKFYALSKSDHIEAWDLRSSSSSSSFTLVKSEYPSYAHSDSHQGDQEKRAQLGRKKYLVDSGGDLLLVIRYFQTFKSDVPERNYNHRWTRCFDVFKLDIGTNKWVKIKGSLGGRTLFVGTNECFSVFAPDYPGLRQDSIYFTCVDAEVVDQANNNYIQHVYDLGKGGAYDLGVFSLKHQEIDVLYHDEFRKIRPHPVWIFP